MSCSFFSEVCYLKTCSGIGSEALVATFPRWGGGVPGALPRLLLCISCFRARSLVDPGRLPR